MFLRRHIHRLLLVCTAIMLVVVSGVGQTVNSESDTTESQVVHIDHAKVVQGKKIDTSQYQFLSGDVELSQDSVFMYCDSAVVVDGKQVTAYGNVIIQKGDTLTIHADTLWYHSDSLEAILAGNVLLQSGGEQLWTNKLYYDLQYDLAFYDQSAVMVNDSTQISSNVGIYWVGTNLAKLVDSVVVIGEEVTLLTDSMYYKSSTQWAEFIAPTLIIQDDSRIYCESGFYDVLNQNAVFSQNAKFTRGDEVASADTISYVGEEERVSLVGNAHYTDGNRTIDSREIHFFDETGDVEILGDAYFQDSTRTVAAEQIFYNERTDEIRTTGRSEIVEDNQVLEADTVDFDRKTGLGIAKGQVVFTDTASNTIVVCENAFYDRENNYILAFGKRRPLLKSLMEGDTMFLTADTLMFQQVPDTSTTDTFQLFKAYNDVRLLKGTMQGLCDSMSFNSKDSIFHMFGQPILWSDTTQFTSDSIDVTLHDDAIDQVFLKRNGLIVNVVEGVFFNQIKGRSMTAQFEEDEIQDLLVQGNAESIYYARDEQDAFVGVNRVAASEILFTFEQKQLGGIRLFSMPDGVLSPMGDIDHDSFRLDGFIWREEERPKMLDDLF